MIIVDTGPLVAAAIATDRHHVACVELFDQMYAENRELLIPAPVPNPFHDHRAYSIGAGFAPRSSFEGVGVRTWAATPRIGDHRVADRGLLAMIGN